MGEEGTGLGPTLEFYSLLAAELQRREYALWICDDVHVDSALSPSDSQVNLYMEDLFVPYNSIL